MLQARDLCVVYGRVQALSGVGIDVGPGELVALLGPKVGFDSPPDIELSPDQFEVIERPDDFPVTF